MPRFHVENFGCRATQADGAAIERQLLETGYQRAVSPGIADVVVLNTCTVTAAADHDARAAIRRFHRENPDCKILVTGCYAQRAPEELKQIPGVNWVVGNSHKHEVARIATGGAASEKSAASSGLVSIAAIAPSAIGSRPFGGEGDVASYVSTETPPTPDGVFVGDIFAHTELLAAPVFEGDLASEKTRPNLKVQDGCDNRCSFCVIPFVRGQSRSLPLGQVLGEVDALVGLGYRELVLSGINLGRWGRDRDENLKFEDLVRAILERTSLEKLRISSVEPMDWSDELIDLVAHSPRIAKHAHLPLQSGSDKILRQMHRKYRPWHYAEKVSKIRAAMPVAAIGADVMVGFPGETDAEFEETRSFIASLPFTYLHVFTFSSRPGTPAATMKGQVPGPVARERNRVLRELVADKNRAFRESFVGSTIQAITLSNRGINENGAYTEALTENYLKLRIAGEHEENRWIEVRVAEVVADGLAGMPIHGLSAVFSML